MSFHARVYLHCACSLFSSGLETNFHALSQCTLIHDHIVLKRDTYRIFSLQEQLFNAS